jgi:hypothetical protein
MSTPALVIGHVVIGLGIGASAGYWWGIRAMARMMWQRAKEQGMTSQLRAILSDHRETNYSTTTSSQYASEAFQKLADMQRLRENGRV